MKKPSTVALQRQQKAVRHSSLHSCITLPPNISEILSRDPKLVGFIAARHKIVGKIFQDKNVLEIGCQEGFGTYFVAPYVKKVTCIDFYPPFVSGFKKFTQPNLKNAKVFCWDILKGPVKRKFDGAFALDVLEHIDPKSENKFWENLIL